jgi:hypothetical protein
MFAAGGMPGLFGGAAAPRPASAQSIMSAPGGFTPPVRPAAPVAPPPLQPTPKFQYYAQINGAQRGPVTFDQIRQAIKAGSVIASTPVWREGLAEWGSAEQLEELSHLFAPAGPTPFGGGGPPPGPPPFKG